MWISSLTLRSAIYVQIHIHRQTARLLQWLFRCAVPPEDLLLAYFQKLIYRQTAELLETLSKCAVSSGGFSFAYVRWPIYWELAKFLEVLCGCEVSPEDLLMPMSQGLFIGKQRCFWRHCECAVSPEYLLCAHTRRSINMQAAKLLETLCERAVSLLAYVQCPKVY